MARAVHTAIDGSTVTIDGDVDLRAPATSNLQLDRDGVLRELTSAPVDAVDALPFTTLEEYAHRGGVLRIAERTETDDRIGSRRRDRAAVWRGSEHALVLIETGATTAALVAVLDTLDIVETPTGLRVTGPGLRGDTSRLVKELPGIGLAEVAPLVPEVARSLPRWTGTEVAGGELYRDEARPGAPVLLLVGDTSATTLLLDGDGREADTATDAATRLTVTWAPPG